MALGKLGQGQGYLKAGLLGFGAAGKTYTAMLLAIGTREYFRMDKPVAMFDTEGGSEYIAPYIQRETGQELAGEKAQSFAALMKVAKAAETEASVLIVDSITHPWRELCEAHLKKVNAERASLGVQKRTRLEFQDWNIIKPFWSRWTDFYLNSKLHIIICGRAGFIWDWSEPDAESGKRELRKTGIKMKTENEFGFEPSLLIEMEKEQRIDEHSVGKTRISHIATVIKDRFGVIDGQSMRDPDFTFFRPHLECLKPGSHAPINTAIETDTDTDESSAILGNRAKNIRETLLEEIKFELRSINNKENADGRMIRQEALKTHFDTPSWNAVESNWKSISNEKLREGLDALRSEAAAKALNYTPPAEQEQADAV